MKQKDMFKELVQSVPWYLKLVWVIGVGLSLTFVGAVLFLIFKLISKL